MRILSLHDGRIFDGWWIRVAKVQLARGVATYTSQMFNEDGRNSRVLEFAYAIGSAKDAPKRLRVQGRTLIVDVAKEAT